jgi:hypothetical protein
VGRVISRASGTQNDLPIAYPELRDELAQRLAAP